MKFALVSFALPPSPSGQSTALGRLLRDLDPDRYCLITSNNYEAEQAAANPSLLPGRLFHLPVEVQLWRGFRYGLSKVREPINITLSMVQRGRHIAEIVRREKCKAVVACTGGPDLMDLPAAYLASRLVGVPFYAYYFDDYLYQWAVNHPWQEWKYRSLARFLDWTMAKGATRILVPNEFMGDELRRRYRLDATVVRIPCDTSEYQGVDRSIPSDGEVKIVYTGAVYDAHYDAFLNLIEAMNLLGRPSLKLHIYTSHSHTELSKRGITGPVVYHDHVSLCDIPAIQQQADLLFLPLAFKSPYPKLIRTSAPTKLGEYLASGRPVLAHAPADSFLAWYLRKHGCSLLVDENNSRKLADALARLLDDPDLQQTLKARAFQQAQSDFSIASARSSFFEGIQ